MFKYKFSEYAAVRPVANNDEVLPTSSRIPSILRHPPEVLPSRISLLPAPSLKVLLRTSYVQTPPPRAGPKTPCIASKNPQSGHLIIARKPQSGQDIPSNPLRPHVAASDRIRLWQTPHSHSHASLVASEYSARIVKNTHDKLHDSLAPNTRSTYGAGLLRFTQFCDSEKIPEPKRMPASYFLISAFIAEHSGTVSGKTIKGWLSGLKAWHIANHAPWHGNDDMVHMLRVMANKEGTSFRKKERDPVNVEHLTTLRRGLDLSNPAHVACWAIASCSFWGVRRYASLPTYLPLPQPNVPHPA